MDSQARDPHAWQAWRSRADLVAALASRVWKSERAFLVALTLFNVFLARRTFGDGIWADNDSVCHYAALRRLLEEILPATGTFMGWTPKIDLGAPFLLYNTPPGLYLAAAALTRIGLSALVALKTVMMTAFLAVPIVGARFARTLALEGADEPRDLPKFVALALSLFSSELFGLEFFFKNGMLNAAFALPILLVTLLCHRHAQRAQGPRALPWTALAGVGFAATVLVHLLSAVMLGVALGGLTIAQGPSRFGRSVLQAAAVVALGFALSAFWLVPSLPFAASEDAAFTWIRRDSDTLAALADGTLLSSYPVGFTPRFVQFSSAGIVAVLCAAFGAWRAIRLRCWPVLGCLATAGVALLILLGPQPSGSACGSCRCTTGCCGTASARCSSCRCNSPPGGGAWQLWECRRRFGSVVPWGLVVGALWAAQVTTKRAVHVETAGELPGLRGGRRPDQPLARRARRARRPRLQRVPGARGRGRAERELRATHDPAAVRARGGERLGLREQPVGAGAAQEGPALVRRLPHHRARAALRRPVRRRGIAEPGARPRAGFRAGGSPSAHRTCRSSRRSTASRRWCRPGAGTPACAASGTCAGAATRSLSTRRRWPPRRIRSWS